MTAWVLLATFEELQLVHVTSCDRSEWELT